MQQMALKRTCGFTNISTSLQLVQCRFVEHNIYICSSIHSWNYLFSFLPFAVQIQNKNRTKVSFLEGYYIFISKIWLNIRERFNRHNHYNMHAGHRLLQLLVIRSMYFLKLYNIRPLHLEYFQRKNIITRDSIFK